jgi:hypothetical protein
MPSAASATPMAEDMAPSALGAWKEALERSAFWYSLLSCGAPLRGAPCSSDLSEGVSPNAQRSSSPGLPSSACSCT